MCKYHNGTLFFSHSPGNLTLLLLGYFHFIILDDDDDDEWRGAENEIVYCLLQIDFYFFLHKV
jgi:hypothetical protein